MKFSVGLLLFVIFSPNVSETGEGRDSTVTFDGILPLALKKVWPPESDVVRWPPRLILSDDALRRIVPDDGPLRG